MQKKIVFSVLLGLFYHPFLSFSQDSIVHTTTVDEKNNIKFQEYFFKALSEKAINHYKKAIENLEECNQIIPKNEAVLFELSKNYYFLNKTFEAGIYAKQALQISPENNWILEHLVLVYKKERNFKEAITVQQKILEKHPKKIGQLVILYLQDNNIVAAKKTLQQMENKGLLSARFRRIKKNFEVITNQKKDDKPQKKSDDFASLEKEFDKNKSFAVLEKLLQKSLQSHPEFLLKYSNIGLSLFPAQPLVYLMNGKALNTKKQFEKGLETLQNGIDFVIDNKNIEAQFYLEMVISYNGLGKTKEANKYKTKAKQLKK